MKKKEIHQLVQRSKRLRTEKLTAAREVLSNMIDERELTKGMYFWSPGTCAGVRRSNERRRNIELTAILTGCSVGYRRDYQESCRHVYASDYIGVKIDGEEMTATIADLKKMIAEIDAILEKRTTQK